MKISVRSGLVLSMLVAGLSQGCQSVEMVNAVPDILSPADVETLEEPPDVEASETEQPATEETELPTEGAGSNQPQTAMCDVVAQVNATEGSGATENEVYTVLDEQGEPSYQISGNDLFAEDALAAEQTVDFDEVALLNVLKETHTYFKEQSCEDSKILRSGILGTQGVTTANIIGTLNLMIEVLEDDIAAGQPTRLKDPAFLNEHFRVIRWDGYAPEDPYELRVRITKYAVFTHPGSREQTEVFDTPVYAIAPDIDSEEFITQYTKQEVLGGIFEPGGSEHGRAVPLAYMTRDGFEDALLQGTAFVTFPDGTSTYFNVDRNNGIAYVAGLPQRQQERFWYFKEVNKLQGYGHTNEVKIPIEPGVTFAGDIRNIGLGRVVVMSDGADGLRIGLIADTGGAFLPNLGQLDFFAGVFPDRDTYQQAVADLPTFTQAYILVRK